MTTLYFLPKDDILFIVCERRKFVIRDGMTFTGNLPNAKTINPKERIALTVLLLDVLKPANQQELIATYGTVCTDQSTTLIY